MRLPPKRSITAGEATKPEARALFPEGCGYWLHYQGAELENWPRLLDGQVSFRTQTASGFARFHRVSPNTPLSLLVFSRRR